jgi:hypothetical protein
MRTSLAIAGTRKNAFESAHSGCKPPLLGKAINRNLMKVTACKLASQGRTGWASAQGVGKRPTCNVQRSTLNSDRASWTLGVCQSGSDRWTSGVFPFLRLARLGFILLFLLAGCENTVPPTVTPQMVAQSPNRNLTIAQLQHGRRLFASRCIECHTLPSVNAHHQSEWPCLVDWMAKRASLKPEEREAMIAYLVAARAHAPDSK